MDVYALLIPVGEGYAIRDIFLTPELALADTEADWIQLDEALWLLYVSEGQPWRIERLPVVGSEEDDQLRPDDRIRLKPRAWVETFLFSGVPVGSTPNKASTYRVNGVKDGFVYFRDVGCKEFYYRTPIDSVIRA